MGDFLIQAAGVRDAAEAAMLAHSGVTHLGFPLRLDVHQPDTTEAEAARIIAGLPPSVASVCITYATDPAEVAGLCRSLGCTGVQLHADLPASAVEELRRLAPELFIIKSLVVGRGGVETLLAAARALAPLVDAFLTDTFDPASGASGATGRTHDWDVSRALVRASPRPVILAGGLTPDNVKRAVAAVRPAGVDAHTGLEDATGAKDPALVQAFVDRALGAAQRLGLA